RRRRRRRRRRRGSAPWSRFKSLGNRSLLLVGWPVPWPEFVHRCALRLRGWLHARAAPGTSGLWVRGVPVVARDAAARGWPDTSGEGRRSCAWARCVPYRAGRAAARRPARARPMRRRRCDGEPERRRRGTRVVLLPACLRHTAQT
ncbi:unnamed protein product, partial [Prorocentrum cordatum]